MRLSPSRARRSARSWTASLGSAGTAHLVIHRKPPLFKLDPLSSGTACQDLLALRFTEHSLTVHSQFDTENRAGPPDSRHGNADMLVLGSRGRGFAGLKLGSASNECCRYAACPVTIIKQAGGG